MEIWINFPMSLASQSALRTNIEMLQSFGAASVFGKVEKRFHGTRVRLLDNDRFEPAARAKERMYVPSITLQDQEQ